MRFCYAIFIVIFQSHTLWAQSTATPRANPEISVNGLFTYTASSQGNSEGSESKNGFALQEAELRLTSNIDAYFRGDIILAVEKEEPETPGEQGEFVVEPEEAYIETLGLPGFTIRTGKFLTYWGRHNQWHTHSYPFIDAALSRAAIFGEEGFNEIGVAASYLLPTPWYFEIVAQGLEGSNEQVFGTETKDDLAGAYYLKNLWELGDTSTIQLDLGYGHGKNVNLVQNHIYNAALTYKWKPLSGSKRAVIFTSEYTQAEKLVDEDDNDQGRVGALSAWAQYQLARRWWVQLRTESVEYYERTSMDTLTKHSGLLAFVPSEYSAVRIQYDSIDDPAQTEVEQRAMLQLNITMGAHPSHDY